MQNAARCFTYISAALEAETLQGQTASRIIDAGKRLVQMANVDVNQLLASLPQNEQDTVRALFR